MEDDAQYMITVNYTNKSLSCMEVEIRTLEKLPEAFMAELGALVLKHCKTATSADKIAKNLNNIR